MPTPKTIAVLAPRTDGLALERALALAGFAVANGVTAQTTAVVVHAFVGEPAVELATATARGIPTILCSAPGADVPRSPAGHTEAGCDDRVRALRADAYVWREDLIEDAVSFVVGERREERTQGPLRFTYLGRAGGDHTRGGSCAIGHSSPFPRDRGLLFGRMSQRDVDVGFTTSVARKHAWAHRRGTRVHVRDLGSTNGTWFRGRRLEEFEIAIGDEIAIALFRLRLDGDAVSLE